jgi:3-dehydroquinate synthetase
LQNLKAGEGAFAFFFFHFEKKKQLACVRQKIITETYRVNYRRDWAVFGLGGVGGAIEDLANEHIKGLLYFWHK